MTYAPILKIGNTAFPVLGIGLMVFYGVCDTSCSSLQGAFLGVDLKAVGVVYMAALLALNLPLASPWTAPILHLRTSLLSGALGGETVLLRFQAVNDTYCPFCLVFGFCILALFVVNFSKMNKYLSLGTFLMGITAFALFFKGAILPLYL